MGKNFVLVDTDDIVDYINGECSQEDMFRRKKYRIKTTNAHNQDIYRKEYVEYLAEWMDYSE